MFQESFNGNLCFEEVSYEFQGCFKEVARKFQGSVLREIEWGIKEVLIMSLSKSSKKSKRVLSVSMMLQDCYKEV